MDVVLGSERTSRSKVVKQADVVQLLALLNDRYDRKVQEANFAYYEPLTGHGSSLSPPAHALVAARLGRTELAQQFFDETAAIDFNDTMGNAAGGVHIGALGGLWQAAVFGFAGLSLRESGLHFEPHLPHHWQRLAFPVQWRRRLFRIQAAGHTMTVTLEKGRPTPISIGELKRHLNRGETWRCVRRASGQWEELDSG
jgi:kojibiose phosphorylase